MKLQVTVGIRNGEVISRREAMGLMTGSALARAAGMTASAISKIESMKYEPLSKAERNFGEWRKDAIVLSRFFRCLPEDLWPAEYEAMEKSKQRLIVECADPAGAMAATTPYRTIEMREEHEALGRMLDRLTEREKRVVTLRSDGESYDEIGRACGVTRERVRQIELKAMRKLRHPVRDLEGVFDDRRPVSDEMRRFRAAILACEKRLERTGKVTLDGINREAYKHGLTSYYHDCLRSRFEARR